MRRWYHWRPSFAIFVCRPPKQDPNLLFRNFFLDALSAPAAAPASAVWLSFAPLGFFAFSLLLNLVLLVTQDFYRNLESLRFLRDQISLSALPYISSEAFFHLNVERRIGDI